MYEKRFSQESSPTHVEHESGYAAMAEEEVREAEALAWAEATLEDVSQAL